MLSRSFSRLLTLGILHLLSESLAATPLLWNLPSQNPHFVGRKEIIYQTHKLLQATGKVTLSGYSGLGKSQIAKEYAHQHGNEYHVVWWFHGNQYLEPQFQAFVALLDRRLKLGLEDKITSMSSDLLVKTVFYEIERRGLQCLFVFDDVKNIEKLVPYVPVVGTQHLIFTTQNASFSVENIPILPFARSESLELLSDIFPNESPSELDVLAEHLQDNPSSLALAAEYIRQYPGLKIMQYVKRHKNTVIRLGQRQRHGDQTDSYGKDILTSTLLNVEALKKISVKSHALLNFLALSHLSGATMDRIHAWMDLRNIPHQEVSITRTVVRPN